jgi:cytochrome oxidase assembly protein ShyY1
MSPPAEPAADPDRPERPLWRTILTPRWSGLLALAVAIAAVMCVLGVWQLDVYQSKTAAATAKRAEAAPVSLQSLFAINAGLPSKAVGRRVTVSGTWGPAADQIFVSGRRYDVQDGFWVVTPLLLDGGNGSSTGAGKSADAVMIIRGWVPTVDSRAALPPAGPVQVVGAVTASEAEDASGAAAKGRVLPSLRIPTIVHLVDYRVYDAFVVLASAVPTSANAPAIVPAPSPPTDHAGLRNVAYAVQWWIFALFTLWMWGRMVLDAHRSGDEDARGTVSS